MPAQQLAGYLVHPNTGITVGVNDSGLRIARFFQERKDVCEILQILQKEQIYSAASLMSASEKVQRFLEQLNKKGFRPDKIKIIPITNPSVPPLLFVQLDLSWQCNLRCRHCYLRDTKLIDKELSYNEWRYLIDQIYEMGVPKIAFLGGEPLLAPNLFEIASYAYKLGLKLYTTTNGVLVDPETARRFLQIGFSEIDVSLDGAQTVSHEFLRGQGTFSKTIQGIKNLVDAGLQVKTATVVSKNNSEEIQSLLKLGRELGVRQMYFNALLPRGADKNLWEQYEVFADDWTKIKKVIIDWNNEHAYPKAFAESGFLFQDFLSQNVLEIRDSCIYAGCKAGKRELIVTPDGFVAACPLLSTERAFQKMSVRQFSLREIWERDEWILKLRQVNETTLQGKCQTCSYRFFCKGGCHILSLFVLDDINQPDPRCPY